MINRNISSDSFLMVLLKYATFSEYIINNYKEIEADIRSYRQDPNCSCKHRISKYFDKNRDSIYVKIDSWLTESKMDLKTFLGIESENSSYHRNLLKPTLLPTEWH